MQIEIDPPLVWLLCILSIVVFVAATWQTILYSKYMNAYQASLVKSDDILQRGLAIQVMTENQLSRSEAMYSRSEEMYSRSEALFLRNEALLKSCESLAERADQLLKRFEENSKE